MELVRNKTKSGLGKYAVIRLDKLDLSDRETQRAFAALSMDGALEFGEPETENEFFVIKLKDKYAQGPLSEYATAAELDGEWTYGQQVRELARRSGPASPWCKKPD